MLFYSGDNDDINDYVDAHNNVCDVDNYNDHDDDFDLDDYEEDDDDEDDDDDDADYVLFVCLVGFLTSTTRLYRGRAPRQNV